MGAMLGVGDVWAGGYEGRGETPFVLGGELEMSMRVMRGTNDPDFYLDPGKI